jgi:tRNA threonylcarbamoyl adenosine modification protein YeaZ
VTDGSLILLIDTATTQAVIALGTAGGSLVEQRTWVAGYRHGEELLARIDGLLTDRSLTTADIGALVVGTGPGAFTGLRVGIATAKGLAHALSVPIIGVPTGIALLDAGAATLPGSEGLVLLQPAGPNDRVLTRRDEPPAILPGGTEADLRADEHLVAVDLTGRADDDAVTLGEAAVKGLAAAMLTTAAGRLAADDADDLATLVPEYVTLPRGVRMPPTDAGVEVSGSTAGGNRP